MQFDDDGDDQAQSNGNQGEVFIIPQPMSSTLKNENMLRETRSRTNEANFDGLVNHDATMPDEKLHLEDAEPSRTGVMKSSSSEID